MRRHRRFALSRLTAAWLALIVALGAGILTVRLTPEPVEPPDMVVDIPGSPEKFAKGPLQPNNPPKGNAPASQEVPEGPASGNAPASESEAPDTTEDGIKITEEELPDGALKITIPDSEPAIPGHRSADRLAPPNAPLAILVKEGEHGPSPMPAADGWTPFEAYRRRPDPQGKGAKVAVMVSGLGIDRDLTEAAISRLPAEISLSFAPYSKDVADLVLKAMAKGHEVAIELPMEAEGVAPASLGPAGLLRSRSAEGNRRRLDWLLARAPAYAMTTNYLGRSYAQDDAAMGLVMEAMRTHGLAYIDDTGLSDGAAARQGVPYAGIDVLVPQGSGVTAQGLKRLEKIGQSRPALAKIYVSADAVNTLAVWTESLEQGGFVLVPASALVKGGAE